MLVRPLSKTCLLSSLMSHNQLDYANDELSLSLSTNARTDVGLVVMCFGGRRPGKTCRSTSLIAKPLVSLVNQPNDESTYKASQSVHFDAAKSLDHLNVPSKFRMILLHSK